MTDKPTSWMSSDSERLFRILAETTSAAIFIIQDTFIRYANPAARLITGYDAAELTQMTFEELVHPSYREIIRVRGLRNQWNVDLPSRYELKFVTKRGDERWVDITAGSMDNQEETAFVVTAFDITERDLAERELRKAKDELEVRVDERTTALKNTNEQLADANNRLQQELSWREQALEERERLLVQLEQQRQRAEQYKELLEAIYETTPDGMAVMTGHSLEYQFINSAYRSLIPDLDMDPLGRCFDDVWPQTEGVDAQERLRDVLETGQAVSGFRFTRLFPDGTTRFYSSHLRRFVWQDQHAVLMVMWDTTAVEEAHQRAEQAAGELRRRAEELNHLLGELEAERARLSTIIANVPGAIAVVDEQARIIMTNPFAEKLHERPIPLGQDYSSHAEFDFYDTDGTPYDPRDLPLTRSALDGETQVNLEVLLRTTDGKFRHLLVNSAPILDRRANITGAVGIFQDITELKEAEEATLRNAARIEVQQHLMEHRERERILIAQDLHDGPLQDLIGIEFALQAVLLKESNPDLAQKLQNIQDAIKWQIKDIRTFSSELRPPALIPFGLEKAIRSHAENLQEKHPELTINLELDRDGKSLSEKERLAMFRIYQELMNNVIRHSGAAEVTVRFVLDETSAELIVEDDGKGFDVSQRWIDLARSGHLGLVGIQERAEAFDGMVQIDSVREQGTRVYVVINRGSGVDLS